MNRKAFEQFKIKLLFSYSVAWVVSVPREEVGWSDQQMAPATVAGQRSPRIVSGDPSDPSVLQQKHEKHHHRYMFSSVWGSTFIYKLLAV